MWNPSKWSMGLVSLWLGLSACTKANPVYCDDSTRCPDGGACSIDTHICSDSTFLLDRSPFYDDGNRLWTSRANPVLGGSTDRSNATVEVVSAGQVIATATAILDGQWQVQLPDGAIRETDTALKIRLITKNETLEFPYTFTFDANPPTASILPTSVFDESKDAVTFNAIGEPQHEHRAAPIVLAGSCPSTSAPVVKYGYLLDRAAPMYGSENQRNPIQWQVEVEARVAIDETKTQLRISKTGTGVIVDWMPLVVVKTDDHWTITSAITRELSSMIGTDGEFQIEWEITDWAGRKVIAQACWNQVVLAAPITNSPSVLSTSPPLVGLASLSVLGAAPQFADLINEVGNVYAFEQTLTNATTEPVTFIASVVATTQRTKSSTFHKSNIVDTAARLQCPGAGDFCIADTPAVDTVRPPVSGTIRIAWLPTLLDGTGQPLTSCVVLGGYQTQCTIPGRSVGGEPVVVKLVASSNALPELNPSRTEPVVARNGFVELVDVGIFNRCGGFDFVTGACDTKRTYELHLRLTDASLTFANGSAGPDFNVVVSNGIHYARTASPLALTWDGTP